MVKRTKNLSQQETVPVYSGHHIPYCPVEESRNNGSWGGLKVNTIKATANSVRIIIATNRLDLFVFAYLNICRAVICPTAMPRNREKISSISDSIPKAPV